MFSVGLTAGQGLSVLLGCAVPGLMTFVVVVVDISWHFWVSTFSGNCSGIYEAKSKPRTQCCAFLWTPKSLLSLSPSELHLSESFVLNVTIHVFNLIKWETEVLFMLFKF